MSLEHPYRSLKLPSDAPVELRSSPGKGWGAFATRLIEEGSMILREKPLFVIKKHHTEITEGDVQAAYLKLSPAQKQQFLLPRDINSRPFSSMNVAFSENSFEIGGEQDDHAGPPRSSSAPEAHGAFPLLSRFNHSCLPNAKVLPRGAIFATRDVPAGEEVTFSYHNDFECRTRMERHAALRFPCACAACLPGTTFQRLSDSRRRLLRGLSYLVQGADLDGRRTVPGSHVVADEGLRRRAEALALPLSTKLVCQLLSMVLLEGEGLLDRFAREKLTPGIMAAPGFFRDEGTARVARLAVAQGTWLGRLDIAWLIYGREDPVDKELAEALRSMRKG